MSLTRASGCKINLLLNILGKRDDGFHELETVLQPVPLCDELDFSIASEGIHLTCDNPALPCDDSNLVVKAARSFFAAADLSPRATIHLRKRIPLEAGLGGGSSNAAATLLALNELFEQPLTPDQLQSLAAKLGSDVPFFLQENPALAIGRGEKVRPLAPFAVLRGLTLLLLHPGFGISTGWAYKTLAEFPEALNGRPGRAGELVAAMTTGAPDWESGLYNSLEAPAFRKYPILPIYLEAFRAAGATGAMMSGSGSTVFAFFPVRSRAEQCVEDFRPRFGSAFWHAVVDL